MLRRNKKLEAARRLSWGVIAHARDADTTALPIGSPSLVLSVAGHDDVVVQERSG
jgi:hypothetical protein